MSHEKGEMMHFGKTNETQNESISLNIGGYSESDIAARGLHTRQDSNEISTGYITNSAISRMSQNGESNERIRSSSSSVDQQNFPVTWLPAMVVSSERSGSPGHAYVIEASGEARSPSRGMTPGTIIQLPASYSDDSNQNIVGLVVGPNTVVPIDSLSLMNFHQSFAKYTSTGVMESSENNMDSLQTSKFENETGQGDSSNAEMKEEPVFCSYCNKWIKNLQEMQTHFMIEHGWDQGQCNAILGDSTNVYAGLRTCPNCGSQLRKVGTYGGDYAISGNEDDTLCLSQTLLMACDNCGKEFTLGPATDSGNQSQQNSSHIDYRSTSNSQAQGKRHYCDHCDKSYKQLRDLRKHVRAKHSAESACSNSRQTGSESGIIDQDSVRHASTEVTTQAPKLMCDICKKMFRGPFELRRHIHTVHENKRPYKCPDCSKLFRDAYELKRHTASHQRLYYHSVASSSVPIDSNSSMDMLHLTNVNDVNIDIQSGVISNNSQMLGGSLLQDVYSVPSNNVCASQTGNVPQNDYFCTACEKNFRGANEFKRHYSVVHEKKYRYKCIHCGKLWRDQYDLKRHCRRSHFIDRDIDKDFIRSCLLDNSGDGGVNSSIPMSMAYEIPQQVTLALNPDATAMFVPSDIDGSSHSHMEQFSLVDPEIGVVGMSGGDISPSGSIYRSSQSQTTASLLGISSKDTSDQGVSWQKFDTKNTNNHPGQI